MEEEYLTSYRLDEIDMVFKDSANIVVIGGSYAGLSVAHRLLRNIIKELRTTKSSPRYRVILISPSKRLYWNVAAPRALADSKLVSRDKAFVPFLQSFKKYPSDKFLFIEGEAVAVNCTQRTMQVREKKSQDQGADEENSLRTVAYHALVIATGTSSHSELLSLHESEKRTSAALERFSRKLDYVSSVVIAGGGPSGVECAGQIATWTRRRRKLDRKASDQTSSDNLDITLISGHRRLLPQLPRQVGTSAERKLTKLGVRVMNNVRLVTAQQLPSKATHCVLSNDMTVKCDLFIPATGQTPNTAFLPENILTGSSYVAVDQKDMRVTRAGKRVYAIGSCCAIERNTLRDILRAVPVLCHNLRNDLWEFEVRLQNPFGTKDAAGPKRDKFIRKKHGMTQICPITRWGGVGVYRGWVLPSFTVWLLKGRDYNLSKAKMLTFSGKSPRMIDVLPST
jgi:apoptosis-inducing factor 2